MSLADRYSALIDQIVTKTLEGKIASTERVFIMLQRGIDQGTGEIFERCLAQKMAETEQQLDKKLKAKRIYRALETIDTQYQRWQKANQQQNVLDSSVKQLLDNVSANPFASFIRLIDPNQKEPLSRDRLAKLSQKITETTKNLNEIETKDNCQQIATGISNGLTAFSQIEDDLISWMYESAASIGFAREKPNPWRIWQKKVTAPLPKELFKTLAEQQDLQELGKLTNKIELTGWVELAILLKYAQQGLVTWFDKQPYNVQFGKKLSYSTFLTFAAIWMQLSQTISVSNQLKEGCFQRVLQILRMFARRDDFPLYGGVFISFSGEYLQNTLEYLGEPLKYVAETQEKARILTLLGCSQQILGQYQPAIAFHQEALDIASEAQDTACVIANLNHLSRTCVLNKEYSEAISYSQRALISARQGGYKLGETNALVNLGYSKVFLARQTDAMNTEAYDEAINYLQQGVKLAEKTEDVQSQSLGCNSLGIAYVILAQPTSAIAYLEKGAKLAQMAQDVYLQGLSYTYLAEAYYSLEDRDQTIYYGSLGMYLLHQINSSEWRKSAGLISITKGQLGEAGFSSSLAQFRPQIISQIGVDGYDYLPQLLEEYFA